jgi:polyhydroxybutyrate depolymerase
LHGGFGSGAQIEEQIDMNSLAEREGVVVAYPDGVAAFPDAANDLLRLRSWNGGECCGPAVEAQNDDAGFLVAAVQDIGENVCLDLRRVYVTGFSNGAIMSQRLLCEHPEVFAAAAPVSGTLSFPECNPGQPVPIMHIHGTEDPNVPFNGGEGCGPASGDGFAFLSVEEEMTKWGAINECEGEPVPLFTEGDTVCETRGDCAEETILCRVNGGNHSWPSAPQSGLISLEGCEGGAQSTTFRANEQIWNFFAAHRLPL